MRCVWGLVPEEGVEPTHSCEYRILSRVESPIARDRTATYRGRHDGAFDVLRLAGAGSRGPRGSEVTSASRAGKSRHDWSSSSSETRAIEPDCADEPRTGTTCGP